MRENKFRAWDKKAKRFYYFSLKELWAEGCEAQLSELNDQKHLAFNTDYPYEGEEQYTDKKDKNGNEIYEGDILNSRNIGRDGCDVWDYNTHKNLIVKWNKKGFWDGLPDESENSVYSPERIEIIGNIHENPELSEVRDE